MIGLSSICFFCKIFYEHDYNLVSVLYISQLFSLQWQLHIPWMVMMSLKSKCTVLSCSVYIQQWWTQDGYQVSCGQTAFSPFPQPNTKEKKRSGHVRLHVWNECFQPFILSFSVLQMQNPINLLHWVLQLKSATALSDLLPKSYSNTAVNGTIIAIPSIQLMIIYVYRYFKNFSSQSSCISYA